MNFSTDPTTDCLYHLCRTIRERPTTIDSTSCRSHRRHRDRHAVAATLGQLVVDGSGGTRAIVASIEGLGSAAGRTVFIPSTGVVALLTESAAIDYVGRGIRVEPNTFEVIDTPATFQVFGPGKEGQPTASSRAGDRVVRRG